jgi:signal transduction histidine kinase
MSAEQQRQLFRPFYTSKERGTGLGLVIVQRLLAKMGGSIEISSQQGVGTAVTVCLPSA